MDNLICKMQAHARVCEENIELEEKNDAQNDSTSFVIFNYAENRLKRMKQEYFFFHILNRDCFTINDCSIDCDYPWHFFQLYVFLVSHNGAYSSLKNLAVLANMSAGPSNEGETMIRGWKFLGLVIQLMQTSISQLSSVTATWNSCN